MTPQAYADDDPVAGRMRAGEAALVAALAGSERVFPDGTVVQHQGATAERLYRIVAGRAARRRDLVDGRSQLLATLLPGDFFGVRSLVRGEQRTSVTAQTELRVQSIDCNALVRLVAGHPDIPLWLFAYAGTQADRVERWLTVLACGNAQEKIAYVLLDLHRRLVAGGGSGNDGVRIPLTQQEIADSVGLTLPHVCRVIAGLQLQSIVKVRYGAIDVIDAAALRECIECVAEPDPEKEELRSLQSETRSDHLSHQTFSAA